jgi:hypothetical protein
MRDDGSSAVGASGRILSKVWVFEHDVHDGLRAHDLAMRELNSRWVGCVLTIKQRLVALTV